MKEIDVVRLSKKHTWQWFAMSPLHPPMARNIASEESGAIIGFPVGAKVMEI